MLVIDNHAEFYDNNFMLIQLFTKFDFCCENKRKCFCCKYVLAYWTHRDRLISTQMWNFKWLFSAIKDWMNKQTSAFGLKMNHLLYYDSFSFDKLSRLYWIKAVNSVTLPFLACSLQFYLTDEMFLNSSTIWILVNMCVTYIFIYIIFFTSPFKF